MSETTVVDARLDKLEQDNRRLKLATGALLLVLAAAPLVGAMMPQQIPDVVRARRFVVYDESDKIRTTINEHGVAYADENYCATLGPDAQRLSRFARDSVAGCRGLDCDTRAAA